MRMAWTEKARSKSWVAENLVFLPIVALATSAVAFTLFDWTPPVSHIYGEAEPTQVNRAGVYCINWHVQRERVCRREAKHSFVDRLGVSHDLGIAPGLWRSGPGEDQWARCFYAPAGAGFDYGEHRTKINFFCNPLHNWFPITVDAPPVPVRIIPRDGEK